MFGIWCSWFLTPLLFQLPAFKVEAEYVRVPVTVLDAHGRTVPDRTRTDFRLFDEGVECRIVNFLLDRSPVHVVFLLDASGSIVDEINEIRHATIRFAQHFAPEDRFSIIAFSDRTETLLPWTNSLKDLRKALRKLERGYRTALYDAIHLTARDRLGNVAGKRVIILLTDGLDNESRTTYETVMQELTEREIVLYIVSRTRIVRPRIENSERVEFLERVMRNVLKDDSSFVGAYFREKEAAMGRLAETNAGRVLYPTKLQALGESYVQIARELKAQYLLTFEPARNSAVKFRRIEVVSRKPEDRVFHRRLYVAPGS